MSEPRWILELLGEDSRSTELPLSGSLVLGCSRERAGFVLEGQGVDEAHCAIGRTKEGDWAVKDLGSRYGTMLNGTRVAAARLKLGDQLVLGSRRLEVRPVPVAAPAVGSARPSDVPQRIGGYRIERLIGKGAMGAVYLAVQESLRRPVALKLLAARLESDRDFVDRFQAEARAAAALSHPNVVVVYDVGAENGAHYLSMEYMAGGSLEQKLAASGPLPWKAVLTVLSDAAAGLAYAESRGIVHRDIKPANLMYSGTGTVKIADLGLATTLEQEASEVGEGGRKVFGTPHFISPEQARGAAVDHRSDLYSLGATAYRLLSGKTPFEGSTTRDILRALQNDAPRPLRELVPELPAELDALVRRLMEKEPAARFPTAEALRRECERLRLVAEHGPALEVRRGARAQLWLGLVLLLVVGASTAWYVTRGPSADSEPRGRDTGPGADALAVEPQDDGFMRGEPDEATTSSDEEQALRERERVASQALRELAPFLATEERVAALERLRAQYPGTAAATAAAAEIEGLRAPPVAAGALLAAGLEETAQRLRGVLDELVARGAPLAEELRALDAFRPPAELGPEFEGRRVALERERIDAAEARVRTLFEQADRLALDGKFGELTSLLTGFEPHLAALDQLPGEPARLDGLRKLRDELGERSGRVGEQERFFLAEVERRQRRALGEALGPGSGLLAELGALDLGALELRLAGLAPHLRERLLAAVLADEAAHARAALDSLQSEFASGGWRRKALVDPRSKKVREVRDVRPDGLVFDKDGVLESVSWREAKSDPEWWHQLFQARLGREWSPSEVRGIVAVLRLVGATRGAELAREVLDPAGRGTLQPADIEALGGVFRPALAWLEAPGAEPLRAALEREQAAAQRLARALAAAQGRTWTTAEAHLAVLLAEGADSLLVGLLSDGRDWQVAR